MCAVFPRRYIHRRSLIPRSEFTPVFTFGRESGTITHSGDVSQHTRPPEICLNFAMERRGGDRYVCRVCEYVGVSFRQKRMFLFPGRRLLPVSLALNLLESDARARAEGGPRGRRRAFESRASLSAFVIFSLDYVEN